MVMNPGGVKEVEELVQVTYLALSYVRSSAVTASGSNRLPLNAVS